MIGLFAQQDLTTLSMPTADWLLPKSALMALVDVCYCRLKTGTKYVFGEKDVCG